MLKDQNIPEMWEFEMGIKFCRDMTRPSLQGSEKEYPSLPQDCVYTAPSFSQLQEQGERISTQEDTTFTRHWLGALSCQPAAPAALWSPPGHHHCWLCHSSKPPAHSQQPGHLPPKAPLTAWLGKQNRAGWCCYTLKFWFQADLCSFPPWFAGLGGEARSCFCAWSQTRN